MKISSQSASLYFNKEAVFPGTIYNGELIGFGDAVPGMGISFIKWNNLYIADKCVCYNISWEELNWQGFIFGRPVKISGLPYLCRSLKVGTKEKKTNEWDAILDDLGESNSLWDWVTKYFWGQDTPLGLPKFRAVRGWLSARNWAHATSTDRNANIGFRPVLEPLPPEPLVSDAMVGQSIKVYGSNGSVTGRLVGYDDYDLELEADTPMPQNCSWIKQSKNTVFINRDSVIHLCGK